MKTYLQTVLTPDLCTRCGEISRPAFDENPTLEVRDRETHEVRARFCRNCLKKEDSE